MIPSPGNAGASHSINLANAPCSWGVLEFDLSGRGTGYTKVLDEIKETGYVGTELTSPDQLALFQELIASHFEKITFGNI